MKLKVISMTLICFISFCYLFNGCSAETVLSKGFIDGQILIVGNEPFTKLALFDSKNNCYILECREELKNELWKKQGSFLRIFFNAHKQDLDGVKLIVNHFEYTIEKPRKI
jgi:hypothetical protein